MNTIDFKLLEFGLEFIPISMIWNERFFFFYLSGSTFLTAIIIFVDTSGLTEQCQMGAYATFLKKKIFDSNFKEIKKSEVFFFFQTPVANASFNFSEMSKLFSICLFAISGEGKVICLAKLYLRPTWNSLHSGNCPPEATHFCLSKSDSMWFAWAQRSQKRLKKTKTFSKRLIFSNFNKEIFKFQKIFGKGQGRGQGRLRGNKTVARFKLTISYIIVRLGRGKKSVLFFTRFK